MLSVVILPPVVLISETVKPHCSKQNIDNTPTAIESKIEFLPSPDLCFSDQIEGDGENSIRFFSHRLLNEIQADTGNSYRDGFIVSISAGSYKKCRSQQAEKSTLKQLTHTCMIKWALDDSFGRSSQPGNSTRKSPLQLIL